MSSSKCRFLLLALSFFMSSSWVLAVNYTFTNADGDFFWSNPDNWSPMGVPGASDQVTINNTNISIDIAINVHTLTIEGTSEVAFLPSATNYVESFYFSGGEIKCTGKIIVTSGFHWSGSSEIQIANGIELASTASSTIVGSGLLELLGTLTNKGTLTHSGGIISCKTGATFINEGTLNTDGSATMIDNGGNGLVNKGTLNKIGTSTLSYYSSYSINTGGILNVSSGTVELHAGGTYGSGSTINVASGANLVITDGSFDFQSGSTISGAGKIEFAGGTTDIESSYSHSGIVEVSNGTVNFNGSSNYVISMLLISGGTIGGTAAIQITAMLNWVNNSSLRAPTTLNAGAIAFIFAGGIKTLYSELTNKGTIFYTGGNLDFYPGGSIENQGTLTVNGPLTVYDHGGNGFNNHGIFDHQGVGELSFEPSFHNATDGTVQGRGTMKFLDINNEGTFLADYDYGTLGINGDYHNGSDMIIEFNGSYHGDIIVSDDIYLSGNLGVDYSSAVPDGTYTILSTTSGTISGTFDTESIPANLSVVYNTNNVQLVAATLPVDLSYFRLHDDPSGVLLRWQTASESNSDHFIVEHSVNGIDFKEIGIVDAAGFSNSFIDYSFLHTIPVDGENYYRLQQVDFDDSRDYSDIRVISFHKSDKEIKIFPNPSFGNLIIKNERRGNFTLQIFDMSGKLVYQRFNMSSGAISLDLHHLPKGMYNLSLFDKSYMFEEKIILME